VVECFCFCIVSYTRLPTRATPLTLLFDPADTSFNSNNSCWVAYVALNGNENYPHFIWVLVVSGFAGTGLERLKPNPQTKIFGHHWGGRHHPVVG